MAQDGLLGQNPFEESDPAYQDWIRLSARLSGAQARIAAHFTEKSIKAAGTEELLQIRAEAIAAAFDLWARLFALTALLETADDSLNAIQQLVEWYVQQGLLNLHGQRRSAFAEQLRARLQQRQFHWTAELWTWAEKNSDYARSRGAELPAEPAQQASATREESPIRVRARLRRAAIEPLLARQGLSRPQWAALANVDPSVVYRYLDGTTDPRAETRLALASVLKVTIGEFPE